MPGGNYYRHQPLATHPNGAHREFRVLTLVEGSGDEVYCKINHYPLPTKPDADASIEYEALSWTWGNEPGDDHITILDQHKGDKEFPVRPNLKQALRHLRYLSKPRLIWCDFVCINQDNFAERAAQVKLMFFIYGKATNVCVWLGVHSLVEKPGDLPESKLAFDFVKEEVNDLRKWNQVIAVESKDKWKALAALMERPWFSRRWVVQELALARRATVHCSECVMDWSEFETAVGLFDRDVPQLAGFYRGSKEANFDPNYFGDLAQMAATRLVHLKGNLFRLDPKYQISEYRSNLVDLVSILWTFEAQDPHDVVYAILSIAKDTHDRVNVPPEEQQTGLPSDQHESTTTETSSTPEQPLDEQDLQNAAKAIVRWKKAMENPRTIFHVDYQQKYLAVCKQFLTFSIPETEYHNLDILLRPWSPDKDRKGNALELPTWISTVANAAFKRQKAPHAPGGYQMQRQNADTLSTQITHGSRPSPYNAYGQNARKDEWKISEGPDDFRLWVTGFVLDEVRDIEDASQFGSVTTDWLELGGWSTVGKESRPQDQGNAFSDNLWRTLVADRAPEGRSTMPYYQKAFEQAIEDSVQGIHTAHVKNGEHPILAEFLKRVESIVTNRRLFKSKREKQLGLAPKKARRGDYICIIRGMSVPVILRKIEEEDDDEKHHYILIGECYLHTMMDGRAVAVQTTTIDRHRAELRTTRDHLNNLKPTTEGAGLSENIVRRQRKLQKEIEKIEADIKLLTTQKFELR